jgi:MFS family permease
MAILFFLVRFLGQGVLTLTSRNMVMKWYVERRGLANALMGVVISFGFSAAPGILNAAIDEIGWRSVWRGLGLVLGTGFAGLALLLARDNPQACGLEPDGPLKSLGARRRAPPQPSRDWTLKQARRTYVLWIFGITMALFALYITAVTFHIASLFEVAGMSRAQAFGIFFPAACLSVPLQILFSWWSDYTRLKVLFLIMLSGMMLSLGSLILLAPGWPYVLLIIGNGIMGSQFGLLMSVTWPRLFGTRHLGAISGMVMGWVVAGSAIGPYLFSLSEGATGSYTAALSGCLLAAAVLAGCTFRADPPG